MSAAETTVQSLCFLFTQPTSLDYPQLQSEHLGRLKMNVVKAGCIPIIYTTVQVYAMDSIN